MRELGRLSAVRVAALEEPGRYPDGNGLYLQVSKWNTKSWMLRYQLAGRSREMGLGPLTDVSLKQARDKARAARLLLIDGMDPIEARAGKKAALRAEVAKRITFKQASEKYIEAHRAGWRNAKHGDQWEATLITYAYPVIGNLNVAHIETSHVIKILEPIWATKTDTASRVRGRMEAILDWARVRHYREGDNPARWRGHLQSLLPAKGKVKKVRHQAAMAFAEVPAFMEDLRGRDSLSMRALELTILTAARTSEVLLARWEEFDLGTGVWTIPGERTKSGREHRVPLSRRALEIVQAIPKIRGTSFVFPGQKAGAALSNMAMLQALRGMKGDGLTVHGFRSSFRDWAGEVSTFPRELAEAALGHIVGDKAEQAYRRGDALEKRRRMMEAWAQYCAKPKTDATVTQLRKAS
jgi:integrase